MAVLALAAALFVATTLDRPEPPAWAPTRRAPEDVVPGRVVAARFTVDATDPAEWRRFDFSRGTVVEEPGERGWDLAFRRHEILVNASPGFAGRGGAQVLTGVPFDSVASVPTSGYRGTHAGRDTTSQAFEEWYDYGFLTHVLEPRPVVYAIRTAEGGYAKMEILSYYCPGARSGCLTFRYAYRGGGSPRLVAERESAGAARR